MPRKLPRLNVEFTPKQSAALQAMADEMGTTKADVLRKALTLYQLWIREVAAGNALGVVRDGVVLKEVVGL